MSTHRQIQTKYSADVTKGGYQWSRKTFEFKPDTPKLSKEMQATLAKTEAALKQMWERENREAQTVYEITIPTQTLTIFGKEHAEHILRTLKGLKLTGTYRITKK